MRFACEIFLQTVYGVQIVTTVTLYVMHDVIHFQEQGTYIQAVVSEIVIYTSRSGTLYHNTFNRYRCVD